jgi:hypothetical protein
VIAVVDVFGLHVTPTAVRVLRREKELDALAYERVAFGEAEGLQRVEHLAGRVRIL